MSYFESVQEFKKKTDNFYNVHHNFKIKVGALNMLIRGIVFTYMITYNITMNIIFKYVSCQISDNN